MELVFVFEFVFVSGEESPSRLMKTAGGQYLNRVISHPMSDFNKFDHDVIYKVNDMTKYHKAA